MSATAEDRWIHWVALIAALAVGVTGVAYIGGVGLKDLGIETVTVEELESKGDAARRDADARHELYRIRFVKLHRQAGQLMLEGLGFNESVNLEEVGGAENLVGQVQTLMREEGARVEALPRAARFHARARHERFHDEVQRFNGMMEAEAGRLEKDREIPRLQAVIDNPSSTPKEVEAANEVLDDKLADYDFLLDDYVRGSEGWYRLFERLDREPADSPIEDR